jgi:hypothetical protein
MAQPLGLAAMPVSLNDGAGLRAALPISQANFNIFRPSQRSMNGRVRRIFLCFRALGSE